MDGSHLWVGTFSKGLRVIDTRTGVVLRTYTEGHTPHSLNDNSIFSICRTSAGEIYLGTLFGLLRYNRTQDSFDCIPEKFIWVHCLVYCVTTVLRIVLTAFRS